ncbi:hypothetical protein K458DRAFT_309655, partial [Lentithecium fluviatile CBS 122367]
PFAYYNTLYLFSATIVVEDLEYFYYNIKNAFTKSYPKEIILLKLSKGVYIKKGYILKVL